MSADAQIAVTVKTAAAITDVSETTIRDAINKQQLSAFRVGVGIRIFVEDLKQWLKSKPQVGSDDDREERAS